MNKYLIILFIVFNIIVCFYAIAPNYVTFAKVYPKSFDYVLFNNYSTKELITEVYFVSMEKGREYFGNSSIVLLKLIAFDLVVLAYINYKYQKLKNSLTKP